MSMLTVLPGKREAYYLTKCLVFSLCVYTLQGALVDPTAQQQPPPAPENLCLEV